MARYNTVIAAKTTTSASVTSPSQGAFTQFTGTAPYTVTIGDPVLFAGASQTFYNATAGVVTISFTSFGSGKFVGTNIPGNATTQAVPAGTILSVTSDGTNWVVTYFTGGAISGTTLTASGAVTLSPSALVTISPSGGLSIAPSSTTGTIDNVNIGATTRGTGAFTTLGANSTFSLTATSASHTISSTTASTGTGSGALSIAGGLGVVGNIYAGNTFNGTGIYGSGGGTININSASAGSYWGYGTTDSSGWSLSNYTYTVKADNTTYHSIGIAPSNGLLYFARTKTTNGSLATWMQCDNTFQVTMSGNLTASSTSSGTLVVVGGMGVSGTIYTAGLVETSSIAFKENVQPIENGLDVILKLFGVTYDRKDVEAHEPGLIAEKVYEVAPDLVSLDENGKPYGVKYSKLGAYLVEAVKSLKQEIDSLKGNK